MNTAAGSRRNRGSGGRTINHGTITWILICFVSSALSFYSGIFVGWNMQQNQQQQSQSIRQCDESSGSLQGPEEVQRRSQQFGDTSTRSVPPFEQVFPQRTVGDLVSGVGFVDREAFATRFDMGVPLDESKTGNEKVILLYSHAQALPSLDSDNRTFHYQTEIDEATKNCENLHVVLTHTNRKRQCVALMGQYESFHIQKFMRLPPDGASEKRLDMKYPLRLVNRGAQTNGRKSQKIPTSEQTQQHWEFLVQYIQLLDRVLGNLRPVAEKVASHNDNNAVIVMVCNCAYLFLMLWMWCGYCISN